MSGMVHLADLPKPSTARAIDDVCFAIESTATDRGLIRVLSAACLGVLLCAAITGAAAATIYRWVDDDGKVHYAEGVPEPFRGRARAVGAPSNNPSADEQQRAVERARAEKAKAAAHVTEPASAPARAASAAPRARQAARAGARRADRLRHLAAAVPGKHRLLRPLPHCAGRAEARGVPGLQRGAGAAAHPLPPAHPVAVALRRSLRRAGIPPFAVRPGRRPDDNVAPSHHWPQELP